MLLMVGRLLSILGSAVCCLSWCHSIFIVGLGLGCGLVVLFYPLGAAVIDHAISAFPVAWLEGSVPVLCVRVIF